MRKDTAPDRSAEIDKSIIIVQLKRLLSEAAWRHQEERRARGWIRRALELVPDLPNHFTPPCAGYFHAAPHCDEANAHSLRCSDEKEVCIRCGKTNAAHRAAWAALE